MNKYLEIFVILIVIIVYCESECIDSYEESDYYMPKDQRIQYNVSTRLIGDTLKHFWESSGFCPPDPHDKAYEYLLSEDMYQNLALIGSLPHNGIKQIRIHYLLNLISVERHSHSFQYNFSLLDRFLTQLRDYGLRPGFEVMGNPSNIFSDFEDVIEILEWKQLVKQLVQRYIQMFGINFVREWLFESWNEPSIEFKSKNNYTKDNIRVTPKGFLYYYDSCSLALKEIDDSLKFGGPGDHWPRSTKESPFVIDLLNHCINGTNFLTGNKSDIKLDFISLHEKGNGGHSGAIDLLEDMALNEIETNFSSLKSVPFVENEGDPEVGWNRNRTWRADNRYAATVVQVLARHIHRYNHTNPLFLYGFDNGFLSYYPFQFTQRTLLARFQINDTVPHYTQFVKKPGYIVMGLLSKLGDHLLHYSSNETTNSTFNSIATAFKGSEDRASDYSLLFVNSLDTVMANKTTSVELNIELNDLRSNDDIKWSKYVMNNSITNPFDVWLQHNCPDYPSDQLFDRMRAQEEPLIEINSQTLNLTSDVWTHTFDMGFPGISLLHICRKTTIFPEKIKNFRGIKIKSSSVLLVWFSSGIRCLKTYDIQYSKSGSNETFVRINPKHIIYPSFQYRAENQTIDGFYRIRAIDFWDRRSDFTEIIIQFNE